MSDIKNPTKQKLEHLLNLKTGYVLDFTNATFQDFILTSVGIDVDLRYPKGSKAVRLRAFWQSETNETVAKLMLEMLDRWQTNELMNGGPTPASHRIYEQVTEELKGLTPTIRRPLQTRSAS
jgi:hypothetical protein